MEAKLYVCDSLDEVPKFARNKITIQPMDSETLYVYGDETYYVWAYAGLSLKPNWVEEQLKRSYEEGPKEDHRYMGKIRRK